LVCPPRDLARPDPVDLSPGFRGEERTYDHSFGRGQGTHVSKE
jgi:hypothetical protein